jgi:serine/threonine protein kinase
MCAQIMSSTPLPPSQANPSLPSGLNDLVAACMAKDPAHRKSSAEDLADDLYPFARRKPAPAAAPQPAASFRDRAARLLRSA